MFSHLRTRLWLSYALLISIVLCMILTSLVVYLVRNPAALRQEALRLELDANLFQRAENLFNDANPNRYALAAERADRNLNVRIIILDRSKNVLVDSRAAQEAPLPAINLPLPDSARFTTVRQFRDANKKTWLYTLRLLEDEHILVACLPRPRLTLRLVLSEAFLSPFLRAGAVALILSLLLAWWISRWIIRPLEKMSSAAQAVASGEFQSIPLEGPGEVQALAASFNEMTHKVQSSQKSQRDFVANVSHDLKTPLTSIQGFAQAILDGAASTPEALHKSASVIYEEAARMHRMVLGLLELARLDSGIAEMHRQPFDLGMMLQGVTSSLAPQAQSGGIDFQAIILPLPTFIGDPDRLTQAMTNLLDNAFKFTPAGGKVVLSARLKNGEVEIAVIDNGAGIPPADLPHIFERFYQIEKSRTTGAGRGTGLGLTITREIILAHGGKIIAYSNISNPPTWISAELKSFTQGSTFVITLPTAQPDDTTVAPKIRSIHKGKG